MANAIESASHRERSAALNKITEDRLRSRDELRQKHRDELVAFDEAGAREIAEAEASAASKRAECEASIHGDVEALKKTLAGFGKSPKDEAVAVAAAWRALHARSVDELGQEPHAWHIVDGLAGGTDAAASPDFFSCANAAGSLSLASNLAVRIAGRPGLHGAIDGGDAGTLEVMRRLIELAETVESDVARFKVHASAPSVIARAKAARSRVTFSEVIAAIEACDRDDPRFIHVWAPPPTSTEEAMREIAANRRAKAMFEKTAGAK